PAGIGSTPSTDQISNLGTYFVDSTSRATGANTTETDFSSKTLAANVLANNGDFLLGFATATTNANANGKTYRLYFAGTAFFNSGAMQQNNIQNFIIFFLLRTSSSALFTAATLIPGNLVLAAGSNNLTQVSTPGGLSFTGTNILKSTGQNSVATASDLAQFG